MAEKTDHERVVSAAEGELANTRRLIDEHVLMCDVPRDEKVMIRGAVVLSGRCDVCRSLAAHLQRCADQVELLGREAETGALF